MPRVILSNPRENATISYMRFNQKMSINQIADVLSRSTRSVWATVKVNEYRRRRKIDCRRKPRKAREAGMQRFRRRLSELRMRVLLFLDHWVNTIEEAFKANSVPLPLLKLYGKNSEEKQAEDEPP